MLLSHGELPVVPVGVFEAGATLVAHVGAAYTLERGDPPALLDRVMRSIAELLPAELRGPYGDAASSPLVGNA